MARVLLVCFESVPLPGAGCVPVSGRFGLAWLRSVVPKLRGARWWEVAPAGGVGGTLWTESPMEPEPLSSRGSRGELWPGWQPGELDVAAPPCLWRRGGRSECLLPRLWPCSPTSALQGAVDGGLPSSPHVLSCSSSWFLLQVSCALGVPFLPGRSAFSLLFSSASAPKTAPGVSAPSVPACAVRPRP